MTGGERDLGRILATLVVRRRPGVFVYAVLGSGDAPVPAAAQAVVREDEGVTVVLERAAADAAGLTWSFPAAWLTVEVHTALEGVGLTAALARALAAEGIPCNVLAAYHHDHLLVPVDRADDALTALRALAGPPGRP
jgi:hypothetical protein